MELSNKTIAISAGLLALVSFASGRFLAPEKVKVETKTVTVEVEKQVTNDSKNVDLDRNRHVERETHEVVHSDGTKETVTKVVEDTNTSRDSTSKSTTQVERDTNSQTETSKEVTRGSGRLSISVLAGAKLNDFTAGPRIGASVSRNLLGPITVGIWGFNDLSAGASLGISF